MKEIPLTRGYVALVDDEDYEWVSQYRWTAGVNRSGKVYAYRATFRNYKYKYIALHVNIMQPPEGMEVDHIDGNSLNCQRSNLRICTHQQNQQNQRRKSNSRSGYKGVSINGKKFGACIRVNSRLIHLGTFLTSEAAARAYDAAAVKYFGEFACLNFPEGEGSHA